MCQRRSIEVAITFPAWPLLMELFLKASGKVLERDSICLIIQASAALWFIYGNVLLGQELCSWHTRLPQFGAKTTVLLERGLACCSVACVVIAGITEHSDLSHVLCVGIYVQTHISRLLADPSIGLKGTSVSVCGGLIRLWLPTRLAASEFSSSFLPQHSQGPGQRGIVCAAATYSGKTPLPSD